LIRAAREPENCAAADRSVSIAPPHGALLKYETLTGDKIKQFAAGEDIGPTRSDGVDPTEQRMSIRRRDARRGCSGIRRQLGLKVQRLW
jgi:hypothetical protein